MNYNHKKSKKKITEKTKVTVMTIRMRWWEIKVFRYRFSYAIYFCLNCPFVIWLGFANSPRILRSAR